MKNYLLKLITILLLLTTLSVAAQDRFSAIENQLKELSKTTQGLNNKMEYAVNNVSIYELVSSIAETNSLNISIDNTLNTIVTNNFSGITVSEVLLFLCKKYELDINFIGNIMSVVKYTIPVAPLVKLAAKPINIKFDTISQKLYVDLINDSITTFAKALTKASGKNILIAPDMTNKILNGYIQDSQLTNALEKIAFANGFKVTPTLDNAYLIEKNDLQNQSNNTIKKSNKSGLEIESQGLDLKIENDLISANAVNVPISEIIMKASQMMSKNYFFFTEIKGNITLNIFQKRFEELLKYLLNGTNFTFKNENNIYLYGDRNLEGLRATKVIPLKYRTIDKVIDVIPAELKKDVDIKVFADLNSLIVSGSEPKIKELESFISDIDKVVPVITIEVLIVQVKKTNAVATGIEAGIGKEPKTTSGAVFPGVDLALSSSSINNLINGLNGFGSLNLGNVTPNFYITLKALENNGYLKLNSTPKIATLNGNKATLNIGQTQYYLEVTNNVIGTQNPQNQISQNYKSVNASLSLTIQPIVSGNDQITLDIAVKQSSFTERISPSAPPGTISRDFQSLIRVKNQDLIMLGGLDENSINDSGSGVPFLSRIPIIKWFFSSRTKARSKDKLTVFIRPTVIY